MEKLVKNLQFGNSGVKLSSFFIDNDDRTKLQDDELIKKPSTQHSFVRKVPNKEVQDILAQRTSTLCGE